jgi:hypothetical protein
MSASVRFTLFAIPGEEIAEGTEVDANDLRVLANDLSVRLTQAADLVERLRADGWDVQMGRFDLVCTHPEAVNAKEAKTLLKRINLDPRQFQVGAFARS